MSRLIVMFALLGWCSTTSPALAQAPASDADAAPAEADEAKRLYADGKVEFAQGRYEAAIALFERAYALSGAAGLLFNLAQAHRLAGEAHCPEALALYKSYLAALPAAENRHEVEERIAALNACVSRPAEPATPAPVVVKAVAEEPPQSPALPALPPAERPSRLAPILLSSAGLALLIAGSVMLARVQSKYSDAERECPCYPGTFSKWERLTVTSYALLGVGGASVAGGLSWWLLASPSRSNGTRAALGLRMRF